MALSGHALANEWLSQSELEMETDEDMGVDISQVQV